MSRKQAGANGRTLAFSRNIALEALLKDLNASLWMAEKHILERYQSPQYPLILVMGPMRSGTTLFMQWLANTRLVAYPSNLLSRFYRAPIIGARIQLLLTDPRYNFRDELGEFAARVEYESENGKTSGALAPNEFWYFWRRFIAENGRDAWTDDELRHGMDTRTMLAELAGMMEVFQKPFAAKGMLFNYNIPFLDSICDKVLFVQIKRESVSNVASVLGARKRQLGNEAAWYSFKIPEYESLKHLDPITQAAGQVHYIDQAVSMGMAKVSDKRKLVVQYEDFCAHPRTVFEQLREKLKLEPNLGYVGENQFKVSRGSYMGDHEAIQRALDKFKFNRV